MRKNNYLQPQTSVESTIPQMVILGESHTTETIPENPPTPGSSGGLGAPRKTV